MKFSVSHCHYSCCKIENDIALVYKWYFTFSNSYSPFLCFVYATPHCMKIWVCFSFYTRCILLEKEKGLSAIRIISEISVEADKVEFCSHGSQGPTSLTQSTLTPGLWPMTARWTSASAVKCHYNVVQYSVILHTAAQYLRQNRNQGLNSQETPHTTP